MAVTSPYHVKFTGQEQVIGPAYTQEEITQKLNARK